MKGIFLSLFLVFISGCSYHFSTLKDSLPGGVKTVSIPTFRNETNEAAVENIFTSSLRNEFFKSKIIQVIDSENAEAEIKGRIMNVQIHPTAYSEKTFQGRGSKILALEYDANVSAEISLIRKKDKKILWSRILSDSRRYASTEDLLNNETEQQEAFGKIASYLMEQAHDMMLEDF